MIYEKDEKQFWLLVDIIGHRELTNGKIMYLIRWADYGGTQSFDE